MGEISIDIRGQFSKNIERFQREQFDYVITLCDRARQDCPVFPGAEPIHWSINDPAEEPGDQQTRMFQRARDELFQRIRLFLAANEH